MKIKKYPQSHLVITNNEGKKLIIDPGYLTFNPSTRLRRAQSSRSGQAFKVSDFQGADVYLITHQHSDHLDPETIKEVVGDPSTGSGQVYGNSDVVLKLKEIGVNHATEVKNREKFSVAGFEIEAVDLPHFPHPLGNPMPPNTGFIINPSASLGAGGVLFHAGDGYELMGVTVDNAALPIGHPSLSTAGVLNFAKALNAKLIIPIHYDAYPRDPEELKKLAQHLGIEVRILSSGEETTI